MASDDARSLLASVEAGSPTPEQAERAERIETRLAEAERNVAATLEDTAENGSLENTESLLHLSDQLRAAANRTG